MSVMQSGDKDIPKFILAKIRDLPTILSIGED